MSGFKKADKCQREVWMQRRSPCRVNRSRRKGAAVVEMALVTPIIFLVVFACFEFGRLLMVVHGLEAAAREGCRTAISWDATFDDVEQIVEDRLATFGIPNYSWELDPSTPEAACQWDIVSLQITTRYEDVSWLPAPMFLRNIVLTGSCSLPQETDRCNQ